MLFTLTLITVVFLNMLVFRIQHDKLEELKRKDLERYNRKKLD